MDCVKKAETEIRIHEEVWAFLRRHEYRNIGVYGFRPAEQRIELYSVRCWACHRWHVLRLGWPVPTEEEKSLVKQRGEVFSRYSCTKDEGEFYRLGNMLEDIDAKIKNLLTKREEVEKWEWENLSPEDEKTW